MNNVIKIENLDSKKLEEVIFDSISKYSLATNLIGKLASYNKSWAIVGGAPRDWATDSKSKPNDIDIVANANNNFVDKIVSDLKRNSYEIELFNTKLGGYRLKSQEINIDFWGAKQTIGIVKGKLKDNNPYRAVSKSAALSLDSLVLTSEGEFYERGFFETLNTGILKLNHSEIEQPESIAFKAIRLCKEYNLVPDFSLQSLIIAKTGRNYCKSDCQN